MTSRFRARCMPPSLLLVAVIMLATFAVQNPASAASIQTVTTFPTTDRAIALTFDAGSDRGYASQILDTLSANGIHATFGMTGVWAQQNPDLVKRMVADGHTLINHSWDHPDFTTINSAERASQLQRTEDLIHSLTGATTRPYFRPPFGAYNDAVLNDVAANGYTYNIMWTVDTLGWNGASVSQIRQRVIDAAVPGAIILMHVGAASQDAAALPAMITDLQSRGYQFKSVREFIEGSSAPNQRYFPQTGHFVSNGMLRYWESFGGLATFGYPITEEFMEGGHVVQYFERARFEWHPGAWPERYDILLGRLGTELTIGRQQETAFRPIQASSDANCTFYAATGHRLCFGFRDYWNLNGGLATFGYPISEEFVENGVVVQYFERQRLEYHPQNPVPWKVLGGLLGTQRYQALYPAS